MKTGHWSALRIIKKSWTAGFGKNKLTGNYTVGQKELTLEVTWQDFMNAQFIPFVNDQGHQGMKISIKPNESVN
jgi:hypothetical protein